MTRKAPAKDTQRPAPSPACGEGSGWRKQRTSPGAATSEAGPSPPLPLPRKRGRASTRGGFRSLAEARALLLAGATRLESFPWAGVSAGPGWFQAIVEALEAEFPGRRFEAVLDCGEEPGVALAALRRGVKRIRLAGAPETIRRVSEIAAQLGAAIETNETDG